MCPSVCRLFDGVLCSLDVWFTVLLFAAGCFVSFVVLGSGITWIGREVLMKIGEKSASTTIWEHCIRNVEKNIGKYFYFSSSGSIMPGSIHDCKSPSALKLVFT